MRRFILTACLVSLLTSLGSFATATAENPQGKFNPPKRYYLALGDSIAFGMQMHKATAGLPPSAFNTGYVDVFTSKLASIRPDIETVNYGCPGETTSSFISGGCIWTTTGGPLHDPYQGSQLSAAISFLKDHRGKVSPITLHLFGNDVSDFIRSCANDLACIQRESPLAIAAFSSRLQTILRELRSAAPDAEIILTSGWNPRLDLIPQTDPLFQAMVQAMRSVAGAEGVRFVDLTPSFNPGGAAPRTNALCSLTLICLRGDNHPSDTGYVTIAEAVFAASGYERLRPKN